MGGAIGIPLLCIIFLHMIALVCVIKRNRRKSNNEVPATMSTPLNNVHMTEISINESYVGERLVENSTFTCAYDNAHNEGKMRADDDEYEAIP